jgi:hypothetical protein
MKYLFPLIGIFSLLSGAENVKASDEGTIEYGADVVSADREKIMVVVCFS